MPWFILHHRHEPSECPAVFAARRGFASPLRHRPALGSCLFDDHQIWWQVVADSPDEALADCPGTWRRTTAIRITEVPIP